MCKSIVTVATAVAILSMGPLVSAQAGGATSAPSKYSNATQYHYPQAANYYAITEFSSSSARPSKPKR